MLKNTLNKFLSRQDLEKISEEIKYAEQNSSAEFVVSIKNSIPFLLRNDIHKFALFLFKTYKLFKTKNRNGVLILFVLKNRSFYILGDSGIYKKVDQKVWSDLSESISKEIKEKSLLDGITHSIKIVSALINYHFPKEENDIDEISNKVRF